MNQQAEPIPLEQIEKAELLLLLERRRTNSSEGDPNFFDGVRWAEKRLAGQQAERPALDALYEALLDAAAHLAGAASAYKTYCLRHKSHGRALSDPFYSTRLQDFDKAAERARAALLAYGKKA